MTTLLSERPARRAALDKPVAEQYHALIQRLRAVKNGNDSSAASIGVSSCDHGAGASTIAANLAMAATQETDGAVLLLDLTGTRPELAARLGVAEELGLSRALASDSDPVQCAVASPITNLFLLAMNHTFASGCSSVDARRASDLLRKLGNNFDVIVVDLPPADSPLSFVISGRLDGVVLVVEAQRTNAEKATRAKHQLLHANAVVLGVILNKLSPVLPEWLDQRL